MKLSELKPGHSYRLKTQRGETDGLLVGPTLESNPPKIGFETSQGMTFCNEGEILYDLEDWTRKKTGGITILKPGKVKTFRGVCGSCDCEFEAEADLWELNIRGEKSRTIKCPQEDCKAYVTIKE